MARIWAAIVARLTFWRDNARTILDAFRDEEPPMSGDFDPEEPITVTLSYDAGLLSPDGEWVDYSKTIPAGKISELIELMDELADE